MPSPYDPTPVQHPHTAMFFSESVKFRFFKYLVDIRPARPVASTRQPIFRSWRFRYRTDGKRMRQRQVYCSGRIRGKRPWCSYRPWLRAKKRGREGGGRTRTGQRSMLRCCVPERQNQCLGHVSVGFNSDSTHSRVWWKPISFLLVLIQPYRSFRLRDVSR